jgi:hypothetical protein
MKTIINLKTDANVIYDIAEKFESGKLVELTKEEVRKSFKKLGLKDNFNMKNIVYDLEKIYGEKSICMRGSTRWAWYTIANGISKKIDPEIKKQLLEIIKKEVEKKEQKAANKQAKIEEKAAKLQQEQESKKEEMIDPVVEYCKVMGISVQEMNPEVVKRFPKPVKKGEEYKHSNYPSKKDLKNCAIFLHNIKDLLKPKESVCLTKEEKWKATKGSNADFIAHLFVCYIYRFPTTEFKIMENGELEISRLTKEDCEIIINGILDDLEGDPIQAVVKKHIENNKSLTFEETVIQYPEVEKPKEKVIVTLDNVKLFKVGNAVFKGCLDIPTIEEYIRKKYTTPVSIEDIKTGMEILSDGGFIKNEGSTEETDMKLLEFIEKITPDFRTNVTICSALSKSMLGFGNNVVITSIGTLVNGINIYNAIINIEKRDQMNALLRLMLTQRQGEKVILPPAIGENLKQRLNASGSIEEHLVNALNQVELI